MNRRFISVITYPFGLIAARLKRSRFDNFIGGIIFGALFSLLVNIVTVQIQETIQKQRVLEALENEILTNTLMASNVFSEFDIYIKSDDRPNYFYEYRTYSDNLWKEGPDVIQYIAQLDANVQPGVVTYYTVSIPRQNEMISKIKQLDEKLLERCYDLSLKLEEEEVEECHNIHLQFRKLEFDSAASVSEEGFKLLEVFHPTQARLKSPWLSLLMGKESFRILSGE